MTAIADTSTAEDVPLMIVLSAEDVDGDTLTFTAESDNENVAVSVLDAQLTLTPAEDWNGIANITVEVNDGFLMDAETFVLTANPVNDAPVAFNVAIDPSVPTINDDLMLSYDYLDVDNDEESGTIITWFKDGVEQEEFTGQLIIPASATVCNEEWYVEVTPNDGELLGEFVASNTVLICAANTVPQWSEIDDQHIDEDSGVNTLDISSYITDDRINLMYSWNMSFFKSFS